MQPTQDYDPTKLGAGHHRRLLALLAVGTVIALSIGMWILNAGQQVKVLIHVPPSATVEMDGKAVSPCGSLKSNCAEAKKRAETRSTTYKWLANRNREHSLVVSVDSETVENSFRTEDSDLLFTVTIERGLLTIRQGK